MDAMTIEPCGAFTYAIERHAGAVLPDHDLRKIGRSPIPTAEAAVMQPWKFCSLLIAAVLALAVCAVPIARAQNFPTAPVKLIVTSGAGGAPDVTARIVAEALSARWGQQVFVTNHPGAAGSIGMKVAGTAPPAGSQITCPLAAWSTRRTTMQLLCSSF
jgi:hypothetical protein